ncbi:hypothetical protein BDZ45DRAFT_186552 [Acephala macrosclerotiorum]|nr:hypothetical protein BDZ45DRAFT_186552 [Acephala macrosclerotiorum]
MRCRQIIFCSVTLRTVRRLPGDSNSNSNSNSNSSWNRNWGQHNRYIRRSVPRDRYCIAAICIFTRFEFSQNYHYYHYYYYYPHYPRNETKLTSDIDTTGVRRSGRLNCWSVGAGTSALQPDLLNAWAGPVLSVIVAASPALDWTAGQPASRAARSWHINFKDRRAVDPDTIHSLTHSLTHCSINNFNKTNFDPPFTCYTIPPILHLPFPTSHTHARVLPWLAISLAQSAFTHPRILNFTLTASRLGCLSTQLYGPNKYLLQYLPCPALYSSL